MLPKKFLSFVCCGVIALSAVGAQAKPAKSNWQSVVANSNLEVTTLEPEKMTEGATLPLVIYLKNLAAPRVGKESDESILKDLRAAGNLVAVVDYAKSPNSRVPFINRDLSKLRDDVRGKKFLANYKIDDAHVYIVPAGSRLKRDVPFFKDEKQTFAMDIIYPSQAKEKVGSVIEFSCDNANRMGNTSLSICSDTILDAEATEGLAVVMADHPVSAPYKGLDPMPDVAFKIKAAVRTLRAQREALGLNGKIVPVGFSRGSGMALMLVTTEGKSEFEGKGENVGQSSAVQGAVVMSGRFSYMDLLSDDKMVPRYAKAWGERETSLENWRQQGALDYLQARSSLPLFLTINVSEGPDALHQMTILRKRLAELGQDETFYLDPEPRGHKVTLVPALLDAMNAYLKRQLAN